MSRPLWKRRLTRLGLGLLSVLCLAQPRWADEHLLDHYASIPGSYHFVRRAPEEARPDSIRLTVFEDFLCPACYQTASQLIPSLQKKYGARLRVEFFGYPIVAPKSSIPARAYAVADEFGLGPEMQQALFQVQFEERLDITSRDGLARVADRIGLDPELLLTRLAGEGGKAEVARSLALGRRYQVDSVPGLVLDGWIRVTTVSQTNLETIIDGMLERRSREEPSPGR